MPSDRTVVQHLLDGRSALVDEVQRLTTAIDELDSVIARIGTVELGGVDSSRSSVPQPLRVSADSPVRVEAVSTPASGRSTGRPPRKAGSRPNRARQAAGGTGRAAGSVSSGAAPQKSIRVHVLDMLGAEDRDFGLAEIIDRVHAQGIQAHDDAVRSITIKLMKDGRVERVGRGQYRLARRGSSSGAAATPDTTPAQTEPAADYVPPLDLGQQWQPGS